ncbi:MAG: hypothetical protein JKY27_06895 [Magnetovibrio sp.]|nr:hypothetical protein [Magnetovibrio sp.]
MSPAPKSLRARAEATKLKVQEILDISCSGHDEEVIRLIEQAIIDALLEERERCASVAFDQVCAQDRDRAHKVSEEIKRVRTALAANLGSLR